MTLYEVEVRARVLDKFLARWRDRDRSSRPKLYLRQHESVSIPPATTTDEPEGKLTTELLVRLAADTRRLDAYLERLRGRMHASVLRVCEAQSAAPVVAVWELVGGEVRELDWAEFDGVGPGAGKGGVHESAIVDFWVDPGANTVHLHWSQDRASSMAWYFTIERRDGRLEINEPLPWWLS